MNVSVLKRITNVFAALKVFYRKLNTPLAKAKITAAVLAVVLSASIFAWGQINSSFGWFSENKEVGAGDTAVKVGDLKNVEAKLTSYGIVSIVDGSYTVDTSQQHYELPLHDPNGILFSKYQLALLIEIELTVFEEIEAELYVETPIDTISLEKDTIKDNYISNCIIITKADFVEDTSVAVKRDESYTKAFTYIDEDGKYNKNTRIKIDDVSLSVGSQKLYYLIEYNEQFLEYLDPYVLEYWLEDPYVNYSDDLTFAVVGKA